MPTICSLDTETTGVDLYHGAKPFIVGFGYGADDCQVYEWDVDPFTREPVVDIGDLYEIEERIREADLIYGQNVKFDRTALATLRQNMAWDWRKVGDTLYGGHLLASNQPHDLTTLALVYLNVNIKPFEDAVEEAVKEARRMVRTKDFVEKHGEWRIANEGLVEMPSAGEKTWKYDMWLPRAIAKAENYPANHKWWTVTLLYHCADLEVTLPLGRRMEELIEERGLTAIYQEKLKLLPVVYDMERQGVTINGDRTDELIAEYTEESTRLNAVCTGIASDYGYELSLPKNGRNNSLNTFVFDVMKLPVAKYTKKGNPSLDKYAIDEYRATLPTGSMELTFIDRLRSKRSRDTAVSYLESYKRYWQRVEDEQYVLHPNLNVTGTDTLRWSSDSPNEQNISKKEDFNLRYAFGPAPGREWWALDYENLELRIPAYECNEQVMIDIFEKPDEPPYFGSYHLMNASIVYPDLFWPIADKKGEFKKRYASTWYQWIKNFGFAVGYGAMVESGTADRAAHKMGAQQMVMDRLTEYSALNERWIKHAERHGYVETLPDREVCPERGYPLLCTRSKWGKIERTVPLNYHVQGTACWIIARAMVKIKEWLAMNAKGAFMTMQIHDELVLDFPYRPDKGNLAKVKKVQAIMSSIGDCVGIPLTVGVSYHPANWSESA